MLLSEKQPAMKSAMPNKSVLMLKDALLGRCTTLYNTYIHIYKQLHNDAIFLASELLYSSSSSFGRCGLECWNELAVVALSMQMQCNASRNSIM